MRLFVAVQLPDAVREAIGRAQERLRSVGADVSWVKPGNTHVTLKFLGETDERRLAQVRGALRLAAAGAVRFSARMAGLGSFGGRVPRVVWAGIAEGAEPMAQLAARVDGELARLGFPRERRAFASHATLGRVRSPREAAELLAAVRTEERTEFGTWTVTETTLMQSQLNPQGSIYTVLDLFVLGEARDAVAEGGC